MFYNDINQNNKNGLLISTTLQILFVFWNFSSHLRIFHSFGDITIAGEGLQILNYDWAVRVL